LTDHSIPIGGDLKSKSINHRGTEAQSSQSKIHLINHEGHEGHEEGERTCLSLILRALRVLRGSTLFTRHSLNIPVPDRKAKA
jgi:hypothetical protein